MQEVDRDQRWSKWKLQRASFPFLCDASENPKKMCWVFCRNSCSTLKHWGKKTKQKNKAAKHRLVCWHWSGTSNESIPFFYCRVEFNMTQQVYCDWVPFMVKLIRLRPTCLYWMRILETSTRHTRNDKNMRPQTPQMYGKPINSPESQNSPKM